ncbi:MAG: metalloregulator ArsR/SmtB family transcription factor [Proteobacteria bacterium]|nr:metalloregulator ArsR/SmtB family transcription factor [Pseudomonadota bacterium]
MKTNDIEQLTESADRVSSFLKTLAHPTRLMICCIISQGEMSVGNINKTINSASQAVISQHLSVLKKAGLVQTRREAQSIFYSLKGVQTIEVIKTLHKLYC